MRPTERESPKQQEGVSSRIFPSTSSSIEQVRDFLEERLQAALRPGEIRDENAPSSLHLTIRERPHDEALVSFLNDFDFNRLFRHRYTPWIRPDFDEGRLFKSPHHRRLASGG